jgi:hypothetical protein
MSHLRVVPITDHETARTRANLLSDMALLAIKIADELHAIDQRLRKLLADIERLKEEGRGCLQSSD